MGRLILGRFGPVGEEALRARDREARTEAQRRFDRPLLLQAGAGTGKTTTLVARLLSWTLGAGWDRVLERRAARPAALPAPRPEGEGSPERIAAEVLRGVVAITFTEAAAAEMAGRAARELAKLAAPLSPHPLAPSPVTWRGGKHEKETEEAGRWRPSPGDGRGDGGEGPIGGLSAQDEYWPDWLDDSVLPPPEVTALRARALLSALDHLVVCTIHAFCLRLLSEHPLEARVHPHLKVDADGRLLEEVVRETVEAALREGYGAPGDPHLLALAVRGFGPQEIIEALMALVAAGLPSAALREDPFNADSLGAFRDRLAGASEEVLGLIAMRLGNSRRAPNARSIEKGLASLIGLLAEMEGTDPAALKGWTAELLPANLVNHLREWGKGKLNAAESAVLGEVRGELAAQSAVLCSLLDHLERLDPELLGHARQALAPLLATVERDLQARGIATFDALLTGAESLLARHPEVRSRVRRGIDQLLVDEFQDTDRVQCEILRWIALDGPRDERPGLFLVGDPKQSIYGWRNADLRAYDGFVELARRHGGDVMPLVENFRSVPAILAEVSRVVEPVMRARSGLQPPFEPLLACERRREDPGFRRGDRAPVEHWVSWKASSSGMTRGRTPAVEAAELEAVALAADLRSLHDEQRVEWREMAVLLRGTGDLDTYLEELRRARIPFAVGRDKQYYRRREVIEAAALVRAVLDPGDHLALLTVLRSVLVGVPDAALIPLWRRGFPRLMTECPHPLAPSPATGRGGKTQESRVGGGAPLPVTGEGTGVRAHGDALHEKLAEVRAVIEAATLEVPRDVPGIERVRGWEKGLLAAVEHLAVLRLAFESEPADLFVERLRRLFLVEAVEAARYLGPYRLANLDRFFRQLLAAIEDGGGDLTAILRALRRSVAEAREAEEGRPKDGSEDAVQVLTIHGAKGLDFQHVYLMQLHKAPGGEGGPRTEAGRLPDGAAEYRLFGAPTLGFDRVEAERREVEAAERVRTLYVAMTRAKDRLVLAGVWPEEGEAKPPEQSRTHMDLLLSRPDRPDDLAAHWEAAQGGSWAFEDPTGALWRFPALAPGPKESVAEEPEGPALPSSEEVARASADLQAARAVAEERMARPFGGAASEEAHELLREHQAGRRLGEAGSGEAVRPAGSGNLEKDREAAMAAGGAVHRALETWDLAADPEAERARQRALLPAYLAPLARGEILDRALPRAERLLDAFGRSGLLEKLRRLRAHVLARELPVLLPPGNGPHSPVGVVTGAVDLLYRDPDSGEIVIADYKTDDADGPEELERRAAAYAPQGAAYVRAVQEALELKKPPRFELWFLRADRVVG
ncbi:MAG TPA: UvrD-helicase domain-containing protein [Thermoanaerobaculia bacterium]